MPKRFGPKTHRTRKPVDPSWKKFFEDDPESQKIEQSRRRREVLETSLADTELPVRTVNALEKHKVFTVFDLGECTREFLLSIENFGEQTLLDCRQTLDELGVPHPKWNKPPKRRRKKSGKKARKPSTKSAPAGRSHASSAERGRSH